MNIFLDSNPIYRDPFLRKGYNKILSKLAKHEDVNIYISKVIYKEVQRGHREFLREELKVAKEALKRVSPYLDKDRETFIVDVDLEDLLTDFEKRYNEFQNEGKVELVNYDADVFEYIVESDMYEKAPFIKKLEIMNKDGEMVRVNKKEIRDAIMWYSYQEYIKKNELESNCKC